MADVNWGDVGTGAVGGAAAGSAFGPWGAAIGAVIGGVGGGIEGYLSDKNSANAQNSIKGATQAQIDAAQQAQQQATQYYGQAISAQQPIYQQGLQAGQQLASQTPYQYGTYQAPEFNYQADPGAAFRMQQGLQGVQNSAAAQGTGLSGATMKALEKYGSNLASQEYGNAYGRYADTQNRAQSAYQTAQSGGLQAYQANLGRLSNLATMGQNAGNQISYYNAGLGNEQVGLTGQMGNAKAQQIMAPSNVQQYYQQQGQNQAGNLAAGLGTIAGQTYNSLNGTQQSQNSSYPSTLANMWQNPNQSQNTYTGNYAGPNQFTGANGYT